jgi:hypothetical protein
MMNRMARGGSRNHHLLPLSGFPVGYDDFIEIELNTRSAGRPLPPRACCVQFDRETLVELADAVPLVASFSS